MMVKKCAFIVLCSLLLSVGAQEPTGWRQVSILPEGISHVTADDLDNIYWFDNRFMLCKADTLGNVLYTYSDKRFNDNSVIIAANPFKLYILLPDFGELITLDKRLQFQARLDLNQFGFVRVSAVAPSMDNRTLWIFDEMRREAIALDERLTTLKNTGNLSQYAIPPASPGSMIERSGNLYMFFEKQGVAVFDDQGVYKNWIPLPGATYLSAYDGKIIFINDSGDLEVYDLMLFTAFRLEAPEGMVNYAAGKKYFAMQGYESRWKVYTF